MHSLDILHHYLHQTRHTKQNHPLHFIIPNSATVAYQQNVYSKTITYYIYLFTYYYRAACPVIINDMNIWFLKDCCKFKMSPTDYFGKKELATIFPSSNYIDSYRIMLIFSKDEKSPLFFKLSHLTLTVATLETF